VIRLTTVKTAINAVHTMMFANSAQTPRILRKKQIKYIVKTVTVTVSTVIALVTTMMFAKRLINTKLVIRLYQQLKHTRVAIHFVAILVKLLKMMITNVIC